MNTFIGLKGALGFAGAVARGAQDCTIETRAVKAQIPAGQPCKLNADGTVAACTGADDTVFGIVTAEFHQPDGGQVVSVLRRGYVVVEFDGEAPTPFAPINLGSNGKFAKEGTAVAGSLVNGDADGQLVELGFNI